MVGHDDGPRIKRIEVDSRGSMDTDVTDAADCRRSILMLVVRSLYGRNGGGAGQERSEEKMTQFSWFRRSFFWANIDHI